MKFTNVSLNHRIYKAHDVLNQLDNSLILEEFSYNRWVFSKREEHLKKTTYPIRGCLSTKSSDDGDDIGYNYQLIKVATDLQYRLQRLVKRPLELHRINTNIQYFGMESSFHVDSFESNSWSFVYFIGPDWDINWGGEFCVYTGEDYLYMPYIPNTGVFFPASLEHMGKSPTRLCPLPRLSIAFVYNELNS